MDRLFEYLTSLSGSVAYAIVFGILVACGLGFPLPEDIPLIAAGYLVWDGTMQWIPALTITIGGVLIGDSILFFIGRNLGNRILEGKKPFFNPKKIRRTRAYFRRYGDKIVFYARFVAGFRAVAFFMAGAMRMKFRRFLWLDGLAALLSVPIWIAAGYGLGYYFGDEIARILKSVKHLKHAFTLTIAVIVIIVAVRIFMKVRKARAQAAAKKRNKQTPKPPVKKH